MAVIFLMLHGSATAWNSLRGEAGVAVGAVVVAACLVAQRVLWGEPLSLAVRTLGLGRPTARSLCAGVGVSGLLLLALPVFAVVTDAEVTWHPGWLALIPGLFAQGGIAEEILFRGYLFGHLRPHHAFWRAALLSSGPFVAAHLILFATMSWPIALAATLLAFITSFPLAHLCELGGRTIWASALVHFTMQGAVKVVDMSGSPLSYPMMWLGVCAIVPWLAFAVRARGARIAVDEPGRANAAV